VVESLTSLPIIVSQSHLHFDHVGDHDQFETIAFPDLDCLRRQAKHGVVSLSLKQHLGFAEGIKAPGAPILAYQDLLDLRPGLEKIIDGRLKGEG